MSCCTQEEFVILSLHSSTIRTLETLKCFEQAQQHLNIFESGTNEMQTRCDNVCSDIFMASQKSPKLKVLMRKS